MLTFIPRPKFGYIDLVTMVLTSLKKKRFEVPVPGNSCLIKVVKSSSLSEDGDMAFSCTCAKECMTAHWLYGDLKYQDGTLEGTCVLKSNLLECLLTFIF